MIQLAHLPPVGNAHRVDGVALVTQPNIKSLSNCLPGDPPSTFQGAAEVRSDEFLSAACNFTVDSVDPQHGQVRGGRYDLQLTEIFIVRHTDI